MVHRGLLHGWLDVAVEELLDDRARRERGVGRHAVAWKHEEIWRRDAGMELLGKLNS
jgi:hypothetical protein